MFVISALLNALLCDQLSAVESLHAQHYIHRDIKLDNFMVQVDGVLPSVFLIDFGLARLFRNPATFLHVPCTTKHPVVGTLPFSSVNGQQGYTQSRRDDLESLTYAIIYLARGDLPWAHLSACRDHEAVLQKKRSITAKELCEGLPTPFCEFVTHVRSLGFDEKPDYQHLYSIISQCSEIEIDQPTKTPCFSAPSPVGVDCKPIRSNRG
jgi:serine/threonine protein kinase